MLSAVALTPAAAEVPADSGLALAAAARTAAGASVGDATYTWARRGTAGGTLEPQGTGASAATYRGGAPGVDTVTVTATGGGRTAAATAVVTVRGPRVAAVAFPAAVAYVGVGTTLALLAAGRTAAGTPDSRAALAYRVEPVGAGAPAATAGGDGAITGVALGAARVIVAAQTTGPEAAWPADTLTVVVAGGAGELSVALDDTVLVAGRPLALVGPDLASGLAAQVDGAAASATATPGGATVLAPPALFATCQPLGRRVAVALTAGGKARTLAFGVYAPQRLTLAPGQHAALADAAAAGCPVAVEQAGTYVVMPFAWDRQVPASGVTAATTSLRVSAGGDSRGVAVPGAAARAAAASRAVSGRAVGAPAGRGGGAFGSDVLRPSVGVAPGGRAITAGPTCPTPTTLGATIPVGTLRDGTGGFLQAASIYGGGGTSEPWTLAAVSPTAAVFFDSALVRATTAGLLPGAAARAQAFAAAYDSTVAPLLAAVTEGVPDADANGRVVVLVALRAGNAYAYPAGYARTDCDAAGATFGEAINLGGDAFVAADNLIAQAVSVAAHETAHVVDNAERYYQAPYRPAMRADAWWSDEGYAVLVQHLWSLGRDTPADAFTANRAVAARRRIEGTAVGGFCERPDRAVLQTWYGLTAAGYPLACQAVRYALGQAALRQPGTTTRALMARWSQLRDRRRFADAMTGLGLAGPGADGSAAALAGAWYLSWAADGVAGTAPALQDPAADLRALTAAFFPGAYGPDQVTLGLGASGAGAALDATLGEPDAMHIRVELPARGWVAVTDPTTRAGLPTARADALLVRVR